MGRGRPAVGVTKEPAKKTINKQDKKDLKNWRLILDFYIGKRFRKSLRLVKAMQKVNRKS